MIDPITQRIQQSYIDWKRSLHGANGGTPVPTRRSECSPRCHCGAEHPAVSAFPPPTTEMKARMKKARRALKLRGYGWLFT